MIGIVNYGGGNIFSLQAALNRIRIPFGMINSPVEMENFSHIIIPGVGHAGKCMEQLSDKNLVTTLKLTKKPILGICVGMQLLTNFSEEGDSTLTQIIPLNTLRFGEQQELKIPHMGWNKVNFTENKLFKEIRTGTYFYYVHSYYVELNDSYTMATTTHGDTFSAAIQSNNYFGVQFHPEKSGEAGEQLLLNFSKL